MSRFALSIKPDLNQTSALVGLGGNVGNVVRSMQRAINAIQTRSDCEVTAISKVYRTPPWGITEQEWFFNACAEILTTLEPEPLLDLLLTIETAQGRIREQRWGPRTLDLDIIAFGQAKVKTDRLTIPHPHLAERAFVLIPLMDICPDRVVGDRSIKVHAADIEHGGIVEDEAVLSIRG